MKLTYLAIYAMSVSILFRILIPDNLVYLLSCSAAGAFYAYVSLRASN